MLSFFIFAGGGGDGGGGGGGGGTAWGALVTGDWMWFCIFCVAFFCDAGE